MNKIGLFVHPRWKAARELAEQVRSVLGTRVGEVWQTSAWDDKATEAQLRGTDLLICLGGDGTMLWAARTVIPHPLPILGVNMGRLGFLTELRPQELLERLPDILGGKGRIEERTMIQTEGSDPGLTYHALNDAVVGRGSVGRPVYVDVSVDGHRLALYRADAIIVATATGSTAYSLSAGGPILHPQSRELVLTPVATHLATARALILPGEAVVDLTVSGELPAVLSVDGQVDRTLSPGESVSVRRSPHVARLLRLSEPSEYYARLAERLDWLRVITASDHPEMLEEPMGDSPK